MTVLITGGAGYVGSVLAGRMLSAGHRVRALDSLLHGPTALPSLYAWDGFEFVAGDIRDRTVVANSLRDIDSVVHLAAIVGDPACARQPECAREVNLEASLQLFEEARKAGVQRFVFASTCSNYGRAGDPSAYVSEESDLRPVSLYAETKVAVERAILERTNGKGPAITVLRFATVFGISPRMRFDLTVNEFTMELFTRRHLVVHGEQFWRPYIHVRDAARAIALVLEQPVQKVTGRVFNVGDTQENYQKGRLVELISEAVGGDVQIELVPKNEDPRDYRVSFERIRTELGFAITRTVPQGIRDLIDAMGRGAFPDLDNPVYRN